jgi:hypothetical protein
LLALRDFRFRFLFVWAVGPILLFSASASKAPWYLNPAFAPLTLLSLGAIIESARLLPKLRLPIMLLVVWSFGDFTRQLDRVAWEVINQRDKLAIERFVEHAQLSNHIDAPIVVVGGAISGRVAPIKGRFNVEGFYLNMLAPRVKRIPTLEAMPGLPSHPSWLLLSFEAPSPLPAGVECNTIDILDPLFPRVHPVYVRRCIQASENA